jgi:hypothetical protein
VAVLKLGERASAGDVAALADLEALAALLDTPGRQGAAPAWRRT